MPDTVPSSEDTPLDKNIIGLKKLEICQKKRKLRDSLIIAGKVVIYIMYNDVNPMITSRNIYPLVIEDLSGPQYLRYNLPLYKLNEKNDKRLVC